MVPVTINARGSRAARDVGRTIQSVASLRARTGLSVLRSWLRFRCDGLPSPLAGSLLLGAMDAGADVRDRFEPFLDDDGLGGWFPFGETTFAEPIGSGVDLFQGERDFVQNLLLVLDEPEREILLVIVGPQFGNVGRTLRVAVPIGAAQGSVGQLLDVSAETCLEDQQK